MMVLCLHVSVLPRVLQSPSASFPERLVFDYKVSFDVHGKFVDQPATDCISLHDMVLGDLSQEDKDVHVAAVSNYMKDLLLSTQSARAMQEKLEST